MEEGKEDEQVGFILSITFSFFFFRTNILQKRFRIRIRYLKKIESRSMFIIKYWIRICFPIVGSGSNFLEGRIRCFGSVSDINPIRTGGGGWIPVLHVSGVFLFLNTVSPRSLDCYTNTVNIQIWARLPGHAVFLFRTKERMLRLQLGQQPGEQELAVRKISIQELDVMDVRQIQLLERGKILVL